jgi:GT2 family glycosyltransferase
MLVGLDPPPCFSIIICSVDAWKFANVCQCYEQLLADVPHEIIGIHDARSLCEGYNRGMSRARGEILIFSHDDILIIDPDFALKIHTRLQERDMLGFLGSSSLNKPFWSGGRQGCVHGAISSYIGVLGRFQFTLFSGSVWPVTDGIEALDGVCLIARRDVARAVGFDQTTFDGWHCYDIDFSYAAFRAGYRIGVCCDIPIIHAAGAFQKNMTPFQSEEYIRYAGKFTKKYSDSIIFDMRSDRLDFRSICFQDWRALPRIWNEENIRKLSVTMKKNAL